MIQKAFGLGCCWCSNHRTGRSLLGNHLRGVGLWKESQLWIEICNLNTKTNLDWVFCAHDGLDWNCWIDPPLTILPSGFCTWWLDEVKTKPFPDELDDDEDDDDEYESRRRRLSKWALTGCTFDWCPSESRVKNALGTNWPTSASRL